MRNAATSEDRGDDQGEVGSRERASGDQGGQPASPNPPYASRPGAQGAGMTSDPPPTGAVATSGRRPDDATEEGASGTADDNDDPGE